MSNETDDEVYFQELDQAIEVSVGDLIVVGNNIFRCTSLMVNHNEPPTVIFDSIVHEMVKEPDSDTVKEAFEKGLFPRNEIVSSIFKEAFSNFDEIFGNKEILCSVCERDKKDLMGYWCHRCNHCISHCACEERLRKEEQ